MLPLLRGSLRERLVQWVIDRARMLEQEGRPLEQSMRLLRTVLPGGVEDLEYPQMAGQWKSSTN